VHETTWGYPGGGDAPPIDRESTARMLACRASRIASGWIDHQSWPLVQVALAWSRKRPSLSRFSTIPGRTVTWDRSPR
jgi:hypothetical protein